MTLTRVQNLKAQTLTEALSQSIPVSQGVSLVPVGLWILDDSVLINLLCKWRSENKESFFAQIEPDVDSMTTYLSSISIKNNQTLLFVILSSGQFLGHVGLSDISEKTANLDQVMRANSKNSRREYKGLMESALVALTSWSAHCLGLTELTLEVISSNTPAIKLYEKCKFTLVEKIPLTQTLTHDGIRLIEDQKNKSPELYKHVMVLKL